MYLGNAQQAPIANKQFTKIEWQVLHDIAAVLEVAHDVQELLSAEKTPTLSYALPAYEKLIETWANLQVLIPMLSHYIGVGITKIADYSLKGRKSRIYALAMSTLFSMRDYLILTEMSLVVLNPTCKLAWITKHWPPKDQDNAKEWMIDAVSNLTNDN